MRAKVLPSTICATPIKDERAPFSIAHRSPKWWFPTAIRGRRRCARMPSTSANTAWACAPTAWTWAATAWATSSTSTPTCATAAGATLTIPNAICIHEEDYGILWKHTDRRLPDAPRGAPFAPAGHLFHLDGRELRVRLLLVLLPGRQHPVRNQADRHSFARRRCARAKVA